MTTTTGTIETGRPATGRAMATARRRADRSRSASQRLASALRAGEAEMSRARMRDQLVTSLQRLGQWKRYQDRDSLGERLVRAITVEHDDEHEPGPMRWCESEPCRVAARS